MHSTWSQNLTLHRAALALAPMVLALALAACQARIQPSAAATAPAAAPVKAVATTAPRVPANPAFTAWLAQARAEAAKRGVKSATISQALGDIAPIPRVVELDNQQPEFSNTFTRYLTRAVSDKRVADGRAMMQKYAGLLQQLEAQYGIPGRFLVAFWGLESDFGRDTGGYPVVTALATLAFDGRRESMFRDEMFKAMTILDEGHVPYAKMKGSWAGAMGQTQFMPSVFLRLAVDQDNDGHKDIWTNIPDALGSTANYLKSIGWNVERTWGREVRIPRDFDLREASLDVDAKENMKPLVEWANFGVRRIDGGPLPRQDVLASLVLPAGAKGPAFLVYDNYRATLKYNRSAFYAIAIGHLADRVGGAGKLAAPVQEEAPLRRDDVMALQQGLVTLGLLNSADGVVGSATRQAVRKFQIANGLTPDGYPTREVIAAVRSKTQGSQPAG